MHILHEVMCITRVIVRAIAVLVLSIARSLQMGVSTKSWISPLSVWGFLISITMPVCTTDMYHRYVPPYHITRCTFSTRYALLILIVNTYVVYVCWHACFVAQQQKLRAVCVLRLCMNTRMKVRSSKTWSTYCIRVYKAPAAAAAAAYVLISYCSQPAYILIHVLYTRST